jgi:hypothetical protein
MNLNPLFDHHLTGEQVDGPVNAPSLDFTSIDTLTLVLPGGRRIPLAPEAMTLGFDDEGRLSSYTLKLPDGPDIAEFRDMVRLRPGDISVGAPLPDAAPDTQPFRDAVANWKRTQL